LERLGLAANDDPAVTLISRASTTQPVASPDEEDDVERRQFLSIAAVTPIAAALPTASPGLGALDEIRGRMNTDLRHALPTHEVDRWQTIAADHVADYGTIAPAALLHRMAPDLADLADLARSYPRERDLNLTAARLCGLVGALHTDLGNDRPAREWLHTAAGYARHSGDLTQRYWIAMAQAMGAFYAKHPSPARVIKIAHDARRELGDATAAPAAQLAGLAARAHAALPNQRQQARAALDQAQRLFDRLTPAHTDERFWGFPPGEMLMYRSQVLTRIHAPEAWDAQDNALAAYPSNDPMDRPLILLDRARMLAARREADAAAHTATNAIENLAPALRVPLLIDQAQTLAHELRPVSPNIAAQYREHIDALAA
jgi:hypothetical protein